LSLETFAIDGTERLGPDAIGWDTVAVLKQTSLALASMGLRTTGMNRWGLRTGIRGT
jgi:hypothetical protein